MNHKKIEAGRKYLRKDIKNLLRSVEIWKGTVIKEKGRVKTDHGQELEFELKIRRANND